MANLELARSGLCESAEKAASLLSERREGESESFYETLPPFDAFASVTDPACYRALPDDWVIGLADVEASTQAIAEGRYKAVNIVGAAVVASVGNAMPGFGFPFVFGGDGASLVFPASRSKIVAEVMTRTAAWADTMLKLRLRVGLVPITAVRAAGVDVRVARHRVAPDVSYAMFSGGGLAWAEARLKDGTYALPSAPRGAMPDLAGLRCDFTTIEATQGVILSLIVLPVEDDARFANFVRDLLDLIEVENAHAPIPWRRPDASWPDSQIARAISAGQQSLSGSGSEGRQWQMAVEEGLRHPVENTDSRKFGDGLRMTLDCTPEVADLIEARLAEAQAAGLCRYGTHRQSAANLTCVLPSKGGQHAHFIDGASGGYTVAASKLKADLVRSFLSPDGSRTS
jgi:hypothetical protein